MPRALFNRAVTSADKVLAFGLLPLEEVKAVRHAFGVTVNDVLLALVTGAVRDYLSARDELPEAPLVALCPMNMRAGGEEHMGNDFAMMWNRLPTQLADPVERLQAIRDETSVNKRVAAARRAAGNPADAVLEIPPPTVWGFVVSVAQSTLSRFVPPFANVIVSNVAGSPAPLYFCGARIEHLYGRPMVTEGMGLFVLCLSYTGAIEISLTALKELVPDPEALVEGMQEHLRILQGAAAANASA